MALSPNGHSSFLLTAGMNALDSRAFPPTPHDQKATMLKKTLTTAAILVTTTAPLAIVATPAEASAANTACATRAEFNRIRPGQTVRTTQQIIGSRGRVTIASSFMGQRQWSVCGSAWGVVTITYLRGRVDNKIML